MRGIPIGGVFSAVCVALVLGWCEATWFATGCHEWRAYFRDWPIRRCIRWLRYVDDLVIFSRCLCGDCALAAASSAFPMKITACSGTSELREAPHVWVDVQLMIRGQTVIMLSKNPNRPWLHGHGERVRCSLLPWVGKLPMPFKTIRGGLIGRLARCQALGLTEFMCCHRVLEELLELHLLGYPPSMLRALSHSLPLSPATQAVRAVIRVWGRTRGAAMGGAFDGRHAHKRRDSRHGAMSQPVSGHAHTPQPSRRPLPNESSHKERRRSRRRSPSSSSASSSSTDRRRSKRVQKAQRIMEKHSPAFRKWQEDEKQAARAAELRAQGEALAAVMESKFKEAVAAATLPVPAFPPLPPQVPVQEQHGQQAVPAAVPAAPAPQQPEEPPNKLSQLQLRWVAAELGHEVEITRGDRDSFVKELANALSNRRVVAAVASFFARHGEGKAIPRKKDERAEAFFDIALGQ